jgi:hypothetical protein
MNTTKNWSKYQTAIFSFIENLSAGNAVVEAVAGSGKSTTIVEGMNRIPKGKSAIFLAFNKAIAEELDIKPNILKKAIKLAHKSEFGREQQDHELLEQILVTVGKTL